MIVKYLQGYRDRLFLSTENTKFRNKRNRVYYMYIYKYDEKTFTLFIYKPLVNLLLNTPPPPVNGLSPLKY